MLLALTRIYSLTELARDKYSFRVALYLKGVFYGIIEVLYTSRDIHCVDYSQRFVGETLSPGILGSELSNAINKVLRLRAGDSIEDIRKGVEREYPESVRGDILMTDFDSSLDF